MGRFTAVVAALALGLSSCTPATCENEVSARLPSPSGQFEAIVFARGCGATTDFNTQLSIGPKGLAPQGGGNALILGGSVPLQLSWQGETALKVEGLGQSEVFKQETSVEGVSVLYQR